MGITLCLKDPLSFGNVGTETFSEEQICCLQFVSNDLRVKEIGHIGKSIDETR